MRLYLNKNGYGVSVIQRLCKTSVKKNLYWEIKDKVIEEQYDGTRNIKRTAKVKVYGLDSNKQVRARLIEILFERVKYHKDKFIIPIIHKEMCGMQYKKNTNRVDHSDNTHDDNVFSYLMAMYVWYDGIDITEKFGILRNTIKTDEDIEMVEGDIEEATEKKEKLDLHQLEYDEDDDPNDLVSAYQFLETSKNFKTSKQLHDETYLNELARRENILVYNTAARESYCKQNGLDPNTFTVNTPGIDQSMVTLPDNLFGGVDLDNEQTDIFGEENVVNNKSPLIGNLSGFWDRL